MTKYRWAQWGDLNAFFGLMIDNVVNLVILAGILAGAFKYPSDMIYGLMIPGTAFGVLVGDLVYTWLAFRLARRNGSESVTAMPLGLDTPSTIGIAFAVLGPVYVETGDPVLTWQTGMATLMIIGLIKLVFSFFGEWVRRIVPQAGLLGSLAGIGIALLAFFPVMKIFSAPVAGLVALGIILYSLVAGHRLPLGIPGAFFSVAAGTAIFYLAGASGAASAGVPHPPLELNPSPALPTLAFIKGLGLALNYLPIALPFALLTVVGGINVSESARVAGDGYSTRSILLTEAVATIAAALFGGVSQTTPYIGHPAYKAMGGRAAYTLATGLFVGIGGMLGLMSFVVGVIPEAAITPILLFVGLEIMSQAYAGTPQRHTLAVSFAIVPIIGYLVLIHTDGILGMLAGAVPEKLAREHLLLRAVGHGFIVTAMLWGGMLAELIDGRMARAAAYMAVCAAFSLFGVIHSVKPAGEMYLPWAAGSGLAVQIAAGYALVAAGFAVAAAARRAGAGGRTAGH